MNSKLLSAIGQILLTAGVAIQAVAAAPVASAAVKKVVVITDVALPPTAQHGLQKLQEALRAKGFEVSTEAGQVASADRVVVAGLATGRGPAAATLTTMKVAAPTGNEALTIRKGAEYQERPAILLVGADGTGLMYAALDTAARAGWTNQGSDPFQFVRDTDEQPFLKKRGMVMFTFNQGYFESRLHDEKYWIRYFDMFAEDRINELALTFGYEDGGYLAPIYPYFFEVEGFPDVKVVDLTPEQQARNRAALKTVIRLAAERGITIKPGLWDHIYRGGGQRGGITGASTGRQPTPGLVWGLDANNLAPYTVAGLKMLYEVFPEFKVTQFRMHDESGLTQAEIPGFWHEVFGLFSTSKRDETLELRVKGLAKSVIKDAQAQGVSVVLDTKVWMEQMGLPYHPTKVNPANQQEARHSYADLLEYPKTYEMNWTLWNSGTTRVLLWSDPDYVRRMAGSARLYDGHSLTVTEMEATKGHGDPHSAAPRDILNPQYKYFDYEFERYWAFYRVWGRLMYNPQASAELWEQDFALRFGTEAGPHVMKAEQLASRVLPRVVAASTPYRVFPTTVGWPEMMHLGSLPSYAQSEEGSDVAQFMNVREGARSIIEGTDTAMRRPEEISRWFAQISADILAETAAAERTIGSRVGNEFKSTIADAKMLAGLARYHSWRQLAALDYNIYKQAGDLAAFDQAIANERKAVQSWRELVEAAGDIYSDKLSFGPASKNFPRHWKDELKSMDTEFNQLLAERAAATARPDAKPVAIPVRDPIARPPLVAFDPATTAVPGQDLVVRANVTAPAGVKWIRLRYRHVNQHDDYLTADMTLDAQSGKYVGRVPGAFITSQWDLMYYTEIVDQNGTGRIYPDLEIETPYVVVAVKR